MFGLVGKLKTYVIGGLALLLPILYVLGRKDGKKITQTAVLKDELNAQAKAADFYKAMAEHEDDHITTKPGELADRLRRNGL